MSTTEQQPTTTAIHEEKEQNEEEEEVYDEESETTSSTSHRRSKRTPREHPLENPWSLWFHNPQKKTNAVNYFSYLAKVSGFSTVESFWSLFNHVMPPSKLGVGCTYYLVCFISHHNNTTLLTQYMCSLSVRLNQNGRMKIVRRVVNGW